jgi:hypothetical protein
VNRTLGPDTISDKDSSIEIRFTVRMTGTTTLEDVMPRLDLPTCAVQDGRNLLNTTYLGYRSGGSTILGAVPSWTPNGIVEFVFNIHFFDNNTFCDAPSIACPGGLKFDLSFTHSNASTPNPAGDANDNLRFTVPESGGWRVEQLVSETNDALCGNYDELSVNLPLTFRALTPSLLNDPGIRVFIGVNWDLNINNVTPPFPKELGISGFEFSINGSPIKVFPLVIRFFAGEITMIPTTTKIFDQNGEQFGLDIFGGSGANSGTPTCDEDTWNFFDITDSTVKDGSPVKSNVGVISSHPIIMKRASTAINFKKAGLFLMRDTGCKDNAFAFGPAPSIFRFAEMNLTNTNQVEVTLAVPTAWKTIDGENLANSYTIEWFYRNDDTIAKASRFGGGATNPRALTEQITVPFNSNPGRYVIEARIKHVSGATISVQSPAHEFAYSFSSAFIDNAESTPDQYLDPGETLVLPFQFRNQTGSAIVATVDMEVTDPIDATFAFSATAPVETRGERGEGDEEGINAVFQQTVPDDELVPLDLEAHLLCINQFCGSIEGNYRISYIKDGFATTYTRTFESESNCQFLTSVFSLNSNWSPNDCFGSTGACSNSNCSGVSVSCQANPVGWQYLNGEWAGNNVNNEFFYTLETGSYPVGQDGEIFMRHLANFNSSQSGGIVEFRTSSNQVNWSTWQDLILGLDATLYDRTFTGSLFGDNLIGGRQVFTGSSNTEQQFTRAVPVNLFNNQFVQFRFVFQTNALTPGQMVGEWRLYEFEYNGDFPAADNELGLPQNLMFSSCNPIIQITPAVAGSYFYEWYASKEDLIADLPDTTSSNGQWIGYPPPGSLSTYFARVTDINSGTSRIVSFSVDGQANVPPFESVFVEWLSTVFPISVDIDSNNQIDVRDMVLQVNLDECNGV